MKCSIMKAAAILRTNEMGILEVEKPQPKAGQILIKVAYCGICATDYDNFRGTTSFARNGELRYPLRFGHEWAGVVCAVGEGCLSVLPYEILLLERTAARRPPSLSLLWK